MYTATNQIDSLYIGATKGGQKYYGSVEASVKETVYDSGWGECLVLVERCFPYIPAPVIYRCTRSKGVVNCEVVAS